METPADNMKLAAAATMILCLAAAGCQSSINPSAAEQISPVRLEYIEEFKRIDRAGRGRITLEEATAYYGVRFSELDKNRDGFLDVAELESILPAMGAKSGKELLLKLDRNGDNKVSRSEFLVITNWLFEFATSPTELALGDLERGPAVTAPAGKRYDPDRVPSGMPGGRGGPWETNKL